MTCRRRQVAGTYYNALASGEQLPRHSHSSDGNSTCRQQNRLAVLPAAAGGPPLHRHRLWPIQSVEDQHTWSVCRDTYTCKTHLVTQEVVLDLKELFKMLDSAFITVHLREEDQRKTGRVSENLSYRMFQHLIWEENKLYESNLTVMVPGWRVWIMPCLFRPGSSILLCSDSWHVFPCSQITLALCQFGDFWPEDSHRRSRSGGLTGVSGTRWAGGFGSMTCLGSESDVWRTQRYSGEAFVDVFSKVWDLHTVLLSLKWLRWMKGEDDDDEGQTGGAWLYLTGWRQVCWCRCGSWLCVSAGGWWEWWAELKLLLLSWWQLSTCQSVNQ